MKTGAASFLEDLEEAGEYRRQNQEIDRLMGELERAEQELNEQIDSEEEDHGTDGTD